MSKENEKKYRREVWKKFLSNHLKMLVLFIIVVVSAAFSAVYVFLWFVQEAQVTNLVPTILDAWTMNYLVTFILHVIFWELVYIGIPLIIIAILAWRFWWKRIPEDERIEYKQAHLFGKSSRRSDGGGAISFLINIVFIIKVYYDGNWDFAFAQWSFDYLIYSYLWALIWILAIFGIPMAIGALYWIVHEMRKEP